ncbi:MAG: radical SAM protein [Candidatus Omnitrophica bacterium]|nr:radical SAM protein [Candidatus Omnitrophota bacterium]
MMERLKDVKKFFICSTNSCLERIVDCQRINDYLVANSWRSVDNPTTADLIIVSTCSLTSDEDESSADYIRFYLSKKAKKADIIIAGCMPIIAPDKFHQLGEFLSVAPSNLEALDKIVKAKIKFNAIKEPNILSVSKFHKMLFKKWLKARKAVRKFLESFSFRKEFFAGCIYGFKKQISSLGLIKTGIDPFLVDSRNDFFYLKISRGCLSKCSYCAIRFATGRLKSRDSETIISDFKKGLRKGSKKFYLVTEDAGCYGLDIGTTIVELLQKIFREGNDYDFKVIISNFNAQWLVKYYDQIEKIIVDNREKIFCFQVPVQSGSNKILCSMNRPYNIEEVKRCICTLKKKTSPMAITTDIIVGFPGEQEEDFLMTKDLMEEIGFDFANIFVFQNRQNTAAYNLGGKVSQEVTQRRVSQLEKIQKSNSKTGLVVKKAIELLKDFYA